MKKFFKSVALMLVLCMTLAFAPACGEKPSAAGTVSGDYKPVTAKAEQTKIEEAINMFVATPYETLDGEKGKLTEVSFSVNGNLDASVNGSVVDGTVGAETGANQNYALAIKADLDGSANAKLDFEKKMVEDFAAKLDFNASASLPKMIFDGPASAMSAAEQSDDVYLLKLAEQMYADSNAVYLNTEISGYPDAYQETIAKISGKRKIEVSIIAMFNEMWPNIEIPQPSEPDDKITFDEFIAELEKVGLKLEADCSKDIKLKVTATEKFLENLNKEADSEYVKTKFEKCDFSFYVWLTKNGVLNEVAISVDLKTKTVPGTTIVTFSNTETEVKFNFNFKLNKEKVSLPSGIATDENYKPLNLNDLEF